MRNKFLLIFLCSLLFSGITNAQHLLSFRAKVTYNSFDAYGLKEMQEEILDELRLKFIPVSTVESFPPYYGMQFQLFIPVKDSARLNVGTYFEEFSTGGRIHYKDYSGEIGVDQILSAKATGLILERVLDMKNNLAMSLSFGVSLIWAKLQTKSMLRIYESRSEDSMEFTNFTLGFLPGVAISYNFYEFALIGSASYQLCMSSGFDYKGEIIKKQKNGEVIRPGMEGIRFGLGLGYNL